MENTIQIYKEEINRQIADKETMNTLLTITFKGLSEQSAKRAMLEAMMRGFTFNDFLEKNVYAIPFKDGYSLVTSIDNSRKIGMRSGIVGVSEPLFEEDDKHNIISCLITVKKKVGDYIGDFSAKVYFNEYNTGFNVWKTKPRTMIAKVAEMHALRKACPEELSQTYVEEEFDKEVKNVELIEENKEQKLDEFRITINMCETLEELQKIWAEIPGGYKKDLEEIKNNAKKKYENN